MFVRLAKRRVPEGRHEIARGVSPGYEAQKNNKPRRGGTKTILSILSIHVPTWVGKMNMVGQNRE